jgi:hypothetical protein
MPRRWQIPPIPLSLLIMKSPLLWTLLLFLAASLPAHASFFSRKKPDVSAAVPMTDATIKALAAVSADSKVRQNQLADQAKAVGKKLNALKAKAKNPKADIAEQLSKEDRDEFNLLGVQFRYLENAIVIEEVRQRHLEMAKDIYQASYFVAAEATEYVADKGSLDDDFDDFCQAKAHAAKIDLPVALLFNAENFVSEAPAQK